MKLLTALDGTLIVVGHITTVGYGLDHAAYESASLDYYRANREVSEAEDGELEKALKEAMDSKFPEGKPRLKDYYRTKVGLSDGSKHWVNASRDHVVRVVQATTPHENTAEMLERRWYQARIAELEARVAELESQLNT